MKRELKTCVRMLRGLGKEIGANGFQNLSQKDYLQRLLIIAEAIEDIESK